jgi:hypothetical protein
LTLRTATAAATTGTATITTFAPGRTPAATAGTAVIVTTLATIRHPETFATTTTGYNDAIRQSGSALSHVRGASAAVTEARAAHEDGKRFSRGYWDGGFHQTAQAAGSVTTTVTAPDNVRFAARTVSRNRNLRDAGWHHEALLLAGVAEGLRAPFVVRSVDRTNRRRR